MQLVDDWEWITKDQKVGFATSVADKRGSLFSHQLVHLPREPNVERILELYKEYRLAKKGPIKDLPRSEEVLEEVITGIKVYFEKALGNILLYRFERPQYQELIRSPTLKPMTQVYGAEHLLRLFGEFSSVADWTNQ